jgi:hypothetical protein
MDILQLIILIEICRVAVEASHAATHGVSAVSNHHSSAVHQTSITGVPTPADARVLNVDIDMPIDPNEPTYCVCNRVSDCSGYEVLM